MTDSLESLTIDSFAPRLGERVSIRLEPERTIDVELAEAKALGPVMRARKDGGTERAPFTIFFRGPAAFVLPQRIYRIEHDEIGSYDIFLVPVGPDGTGMLYEAFFTWGTHVAGPASFVLRASSVPCP